MPVTLPATRPLGLFGLARQLVHLAPVAPLILTPHAAHPLPAPQDQGIWRSPPMARTAVDWDPPPGPAALGTARAREAILDAGAQARRALQQIMADEDAQVFAALDRVAAEGWDVPGPPPVLYRQPVPGRPLLVGLEGEADNPPLRGQTDRMVFFDDAVDWGNGRDQAGIVMTPADRHARVQMPPDALRVIAEGNIPAVSMGAMVAVSEPEYVGRIPVRTEMTVLPADEPGRRPLGFTVRERPGIAAYNPRALARLEQFREADDVRLPLARQVVVPEFEIQASPQIPLDDIRRRRFDLLDRGGTGSGPVERRGLDSEWIALREAQKAAGLVIESAVTALLARRRLAV